VSLDTPLGPGAEFDLIRDILARLGTRATGIGDDAAVADVPRGESLVASVDTVVAGQHFLRHWLTPREIGYRATAAALSDLAAMAARPIGVLVALTIPADWTDDVSSIADGIGDAVDAARTNVLGGNLSAGSELSITTTVLGSAFEPLRRSGARPGDRVYVTGRLGGPGDVLRRLRAGNDAGTHRERFVHPSPRLDEARWLAANGALACIDISDGLLADLRHLAIASGVEIALDAERIPCAAGVDRDVAQHSGEEYEIIVTAHDRFDAAAFERRFGLPLTEIGAARAGPGSVVVDGHRVAAAAGYDHFSD
jgi:thiamine-monophosphate kinase